MDLGTVSKEEGAKNNRLKTKKGTTTKQTQPHKNPNQPEQNVCLEVLWKVFIENMMKEKRKKKSVQGLKKCSNQTQKFCCKSIVEVIIVIYFK